MVVDIFISNKSRWNRTAAFGFVRYATVKEAQSAITKLNGLAVQGRRLIVSMARYEKGGVPIQKFSLPAEK